MPAYLEKDGNCSIEEHQMNRNNVRDEEAGRHPLKMLTAHGHCKVSHRK